MENLKNHLRSLIQLALTDHCFDQAEEKYIRNLGEAHKISESEIDELLREQLKDKDHGRLTFSALSDDEKIDYLYNIVQLTKVDQKVYLSEIRYCEDVARKLGFSPKVVKKVSGHIYSDSIVSARREDLRRIIYSYQQ